MLIAPMRSSSRMSAWPSVRTSHASLANSQLSRPAALDEPGEGTGAEAVEHLGKALHLALKFGEGGLIVGRSRPQAGRLSMTSCRPSPDSTTVLRSRAA